MSLIADAYFILVVTSEDISIIDISDPLNPAYCFMASTCPLSAYEYLSTCHELEGKHPCTALRGRSLMPL